MLLLIIGVQVLFDVLRYARIIDWSSWFGLMPVYIGGPLWLLWTGLKVWAVNATKEYSEE